MMLSETQILLHQVAGQLGSNESDRIWEDVNIAKCNIVA